MGTNILRRASVSRTTLTRAPTAEISRQELHGLIDQSARTASPGRSASELEAELELVDGAEATPVPRPVPGGARLAHTLRRDPTPPIAIGRPTRVMPPSAMAALVQRQASEAPEPDAASDLDLEIAIARTATDDEPALTRTVTPTAPTLTRAIPALARAATERIVRAPRHRQLLLIALLAAAFAEFAFLTLRAIFH